MGLKHFFTISMNFLTLCFKEYHSEKFNFFLDVQLFRCVGILVFWGPCTRDVL